MALCAAGIVDWTGVDEGIGEQKQGTKAIQRRNEENEENPKTRSGFGIGGRTSYG